MAKRLSAATAAPLPYDRSRVTPGIVHIGIGAFFRAHAATYVDSLLAGDPSWGIVGVSLRRSDTREALAPQDGLYTVAVCSAQGMDCRTIGSVLEVMDANTQRDAVIETMCDPRVRIVSLTVTEKGYCHDPATGRLDPAHRDIVHDLANPGEPVSAAGLIVRALELRRASGVPPFTVMSCDNLPANGETTARVVTEFAALRDPALADHVRNDVSFPSTMVDRIVPATTPADRQAVTEATGLDDAWPVMTEPFTQWVIEDDFPAGRPPFEDAGAQMVGDVHDFELMKLRMLNGSHSPLAYLGYLAGYETVSETISDPDIAAFVRGLLHDEVIATLPGGLGDMPAYADALLERYTNPALKHRTWQIAMDGSQKLPQRLLGTIRDRLAAGLPVDRLALGVAAWMRYASGTDEKGAAIDVRDPLADRFKAIAGEAGDDPAALVAGFLGLREVFGVDLPQDDALRATITAHLASLIDNGALATVRALNARLDS